MGLPLQDIPVIDLEPFLHGDALARNAVATEIYKACARVGFLYLRNHGVREDQVSELFAESRRFFALPLDVKNQLAWTSETDNRGYIGVGEEQLDPGRPHDRKEAFQVRRETDLHSVPTSFPPRSTFGNLWPHDLPGFRRVVLEFFDACLRLSTDVLRAYAVALRIRETFFEESHTPGAHTLRLLHYPPCEGESGAGPTRAGAHSDYGSITLLFQVEVGGLEVRNASGGWIAAPPIPGTILVNTGDLMERWTNREFVSTKHRVVGHPELSASRHRYSAAFFCDPNADAEIACLESCQGPDRPPLDPPITAGDYLLERLRSTH
jgi:isopenicillin N synthase-like dioxygenase